MKTQIVLHIYVKLRSGVVTLDYLKNNLNLDTNKRTRYINEVRLYFANNYI